MNSDKPPPGVSTGPAYQSSSIVFVGNIPFGLPETQIVEIFSAVGRVVCFRLVFDRETGRSKGYGFAEYVDDETAASAVRNLDNYEILGRKLRVDYSSHGHIPEAPHPNPFPDLPRGMELPQGLSAVEAISRTMDAIPPAKLSELLGEMHDLAVKDPLRVTELLKHAPQLSYALFEAMVKTGQVDMAQMERYLEPADASLRGSLPISHRSFGKESNSKGSSAELRSLISVPPSSIAPALLGHQHNMPASFPISSEMQSFIAQRANSSNRPTKISNSVHQAPIIATAHNTQDPNVALLQQVLKIPMDQIEVLPADQKKQILQLRKRLSSGILGEAAATVKTAV
ncbi:hypothetical protein L873DRAFT_1812245 [Choiromyces venosus 120613-1]|uniref:RRM domain-containing protein n=1 Tax=Choiromyces venosus 120613-1 TaxID=1336337 RepID=A0A3N4JG05_9PEZI|nr:hypothetical protein L873DRAFT_1812245 [Choiromyces venosus 120613-1]